MDDRRSVEDIVARILSDNLDLLTEDCSEAEELAALKRSSDRELTGRKRFVVQATTTPGEAP